MAAPTSPPPPRLEGALLEMLVVMGINESMPILASDIRNSESELELETSSLTFSPQVLAAISATTALFPPISPRPDDDYPPHIRRPGSITDFGAKPPLPPPVQLTRGGVDKGVGGRRWATVKGRLAQVKEIDEARAAGLMRTLSKRVKVDAQNGVKVTTAAKPNELPMSLEDLNNLVPFCFPDGCTVHEDPQVDHVHHLVLTNLLGSRAYATCLTHYTRQYSHQTRDGSWAFSLADKNLTVVQQRVVYLPQCCLIISKHPYFCVMKDCLSRLVQRWSERDDDHERRRIMKEFALQLSLTPVPPPGRVNLQLQLYDVVLTLPCPDTPHRAPLDLALTLLLRCLDPQTILLVLTMLITQQPVVFLASHYALLTLVTEAFVHLLFPLRWNFVYVPVLSQSMLGLLEAPGVFIMGCHSKHWKLVLEVEGLVMVNLDEGSVQVNKGIEVLSLPRGAVIEFKDALRRLLCRLDLWRLDSVTSFSYEETRAMELRQQLKSNLTISQIFLELMASLFRGVLQHIEPESRFFHRDQFLESVHIEDRPFYEKVLQTDMFSAFLKDRFDRRQDAWTDQVNRRKLTHRASQYDMADHAKGRRLSRVLLRSAASMSNLSSATLGSSGYSTGSSAGLPWSMASGLYQSAERVCLRLPNFLYALSHTYLDSVHQDVSTAITTSFAYLEERNSYVYLRALLSAARGNKMAALEDFCNLDHNGSRLFPAEYVSELMSLMSESERSELESSDLYKNSDALQKLCSDRSAEQRRRQPIITQLKQIPEMHIDLERFVQLVSMLDITQHVASIHRLFAALTTDRATVVDPTTFEELYKSWKEGEGEVTRCSNLMESADRDEVVRVSEVIRCTAGTGRIVLTHTRLLYVPEGSVRPGAAILLSDIASIEKVVQRSFFKQSFALRVNTKGESGRHLTLHLRDELLAWFLFLHEMRAGRAQSDALGDPNIAHLAALNVQLVDAFIRSGEIESCSHHAEVQERASSLCYFMSLKSDEYASLPPGSERGLLRRLDPSAGSFNKMAVESILYTQPRSSREGGEVVPARLWCGLSSGQIVVYQAETWLLELQLNPASKRVGCLLEVTPQHVWAGSFDKHIYILSNQSELSVESVLGEHRDMVVDLALSPDSRLVYSAGVDGLILVWEARNHVLIRTILCPSAKVLRSIFIYDNKLWLCCRSTLLVAALDGTVMSRVTFRDDQNKPAQIECCLITPSNQLWVGLRRPGLVKVLDAATLALVTTLTVSKKGISTLLVVGDKVWVAAKDHIIHAVAGSGSAGSGLAGPGLVGAGAGARCGLEVEAQCCAHNDRVLAMRAVQGTYVLTGAGSGDGRIAVWAWPPD